MPAPASAPKPTPSYINYEQTEAQTAKKARLKLFSAIGGIFAIIALILLVVYIIDNNSGTDNESEEPLIEYAGDNSKIAGIQFLTEYGLSFEQYRSVHSSLTSELEKLEPSATYFDLVPNSVRLETNETGVETVLSNAELAAILAKLAETGDHTATNIATEEPETSDKSEAMPENIVFEMLSSAGNYYTVKVVPAADFNIKTIVTSIREAN